LRRTHALPFWREVVEQLNLGRNRRRSVAVLSCKNKELSREQEGGLPRAGARCGVVGRAPETRWQAGRLTGRHAARSPDPQQLPGRCTRRQLLDAMTDPD